MAERAVTRMSEAEFLAFTLDREERWELVDGVPCAMAGAGRSHERITMNAIRVIGNQLLDTPCEPFGADTFLRISSSKYRIADAGVECGKMRSEDRWAVDPRLVIKVLSPSNRYWDVFRKLEDYKLIVGLLFIIVLDFDQPRATLLTRGEQGAGEVWTHSTIMGLHERVVIGPLGLDLPLAELYRRVEFPPAAEGLRLVLG